MTDPTEPFEPTEPSRDLPLEDILAAAERIRGRVHFTTSYVDGAIVFGSTRRDRDLRLSFTAGDARYADGKRDSDASRGAFASGVKSMWGCCARSDRSTRSGWAAIARSSSVGTCRPR